MKNLISFNQLAYLKDNTGEKTEMERSISDYFECMTECDDDTQTCKRVCREFLTHS